MGLFNFFKTSSYIPAPKQVLDVAWSKNPSGKYRRFAFAEVDNTNSKDELGIYIIWHAGVKPDWVYVGITDDLESDLKDLQRNPEIDSYEKYGGLYVTWKFFPKTLAGGAFAFLSTVLQPQVYNPQSRKYSSYDHVKVLPPGYRMDSFLKLLK